MTKLIPIAAGIAALLLTVSARAQNTRVYVPFSFVAADQALPAGEYQVTVDKAFRRIELRSLDGRTGLYATINPVYRSKRAADKGMLTFHKYGDTYVLSAMWSAGQELGRELLPSKVERELARVNRPVEVASVAWPR